MSASSSASVAASLANAEADITHVEMADETPQEMTDMRLVIAVRDTTHLEAVLRAVAYVRATEKSIDERGFAVMQEVYAERPPEERVAPAALKAIMRDQRALVLRNPKRALMTLPALLHESQAARDEALEIVRRIVTAGDPLSAEGKRRLARVERAFGRPPPASKRAASKEALPQ